MTASVEKLQSLPDAAWIMTTGGDARILLDPETGLNRYFSAPLPSALLAYASSTANDISAPAFDHVRKVFEEFGQALSPGDYALRLEAMRHRIRRAYRLGADTAIVFAPSGTDLEYVALAAVLGKGRGGTHSILLGADEVGSGCIHSAHGRYFAESTALGVRTRPGDPVPGLGGVEVEMVDVPVRDARGRVRCSAEIAGRMDQAVAAAASDGRHTLIHIVHGSKTGLILPHLEDIDRLRADHSGGVDFVVDACQARIAAPAVGEYLERGAIVFVTGSKFMGGPPFSGFALVPRGLAETAPPLPFGLATIFSRAEWPSCWPGADILPQTANPGLLLRLEAALFELERFDALPPEQVERVILAFHAAVRAQIVERTPARRIAPYAPGEAEEAETHPIEMRTLSTLDLSALNGGSTFEDAQRWHRDMIRHGVRLGQPVKCVALPDPGSGSGAGGRWGATLRVGLAMWQIADRAALSDQVLAGSFDDDMAKVREALAAVSA